MASGQLPADWEVLPHSARVRRVIEVGRQARSDEAAAQLLREWATGGFTQRLLAVYACHGSRDSAPLVQGIADPSRLIARVALAVLCDVGDDDSLLKALRDLPPRRAAPILFWIRRVRPAVVDRFVAARAAEGDVTAWPIVPLGSPPILDQFLVPAAERGGATFWRRLAALHPGRATVEICARLDALTSPDGLLFAAAQTVIEVLADRDPDAALTVVVALRRHLRLALIRLQTLAQRRPRAVADLVLSAGEAVNVSFKRVAHRLDVPRIVGLCRRSDGHLDDPSRWLARLAPEGRLAVYGDLAPAWTAGDGMIAVGILRRLPAATRSTEARRVAGLPVLATRPLGRLPFLGLLPWDEVVAAIWPWLAHPEADYRLGALGALIEATRFDRSRLGELLELLKARQNEQDPVRSVFLSGLAALPPGRWAVPHLTALTQVIRSALDASDLSATSVAALGRLVFALLPFHPDWAAQRLAEVTRERGHLAWSGRLLTVEEVQRVAATLTPVVAAWVNRADEGRVNALAAAVGRRLPDWPELVGFLERLLTIGTDFGAATAMSLLIRHVPAEREQIILAALATDESWVQHAPVRNFLHARRQDRLTPFLGQRAYLGRFSRVALRHVLPLTAGFHRWTDAQQETFAETLAEVAQPTHRNDAQVTFDILDAVRRLPNLPAVGPERLVQLARDRRPAVQETAVRALGRLDARQGLPELLDALGDRRARWAVYALRQALRDLPSARVLAVMRAVPLGKVTVAKEAVRLAGELGGAEALGWFGDLHRLDLHRDVRGALLRALWDHLDRPEAWAILDESVRSPDPGIVIGLARISVGQASAEARERVAGLLRRLLDHPEPTVRVAVLNRLTTQPVPDPARGLVTTTLARLASDLPDERAAGLAAAVAGATDLDAPVFAASFTDLLPNRRELDAAVTGFVSQTQWLGPRLQAVRAAVLAAVEADPAVPTLHIRLAAARFNAEAFARWTLTLVGTTRWYGPTQAAVAAALANAGHSAADLEEAEAVWAIDHDPAVRWLALRTLGRAAILQGWTSERRGRLQRYQADPSHLVADEAALVFPPLVAASADQPDSRTSG